MEKNYNNDEKKVLDKADRRKTKKSKKPKMKVSGKSVFRIKKIIEEK